MRGGALQLFTRNSAVNPYARRFVSRWRLQGGAEVSDFQTLLEAQVPRLRRYARALTRNRDRADDLVQDTLVRAISKQQLWQEGTNLRAWLFTLMHNQFVNDLRRSQRESGNIDLADIPSSLTAVSDPTASVQLKELEIALGRLSTEQRETILLAGLENFRYEHIAEIFAVPIGTVRSRLSRGREALRRELEGKEMEAPFASEMVASLRSQRASAKRSSNAEYQTVPNGW
jgi:RNA polymerase sigma-70 factor (ECF subfamily)